MRAGDPKYANLPHYGNAGEIARINAAMAPWQTQLQADYTKWSALGTNDWFDSPYLHMLQTYEGGDFLAKPELLEIFGPGAPKALDWLNTIGATILLTGENSSPYLLVGSLWARGHESAFDTAKYVAGEIAGPGAGFVRPQESAFVEGGGQRLLQHQAHNIVMKNGKVAGIIGSFPGGVFEVKAKAVVMTTGGFGGNWEMLERYQPNKLANYNPQEQEIKWVNIKNYNTTNSIAAATGEGMLMAQKAGANLYQMDQIQLLPGSTTAPATSYLETTMYVNELGKRIVNETGRRDELSLSYIAQEKRGGSSWAVGGTWTVLPSDNPPVIQPTTGFGGASLTSYSNVNDLGTALLTQAFGRTPTTSELNTFVTNFTAAQTDYNDSLSGTGTYSAPGRDWAGKNVKMREPLSPPFYYTAVARPYVHHTMGGIEINVNCEALDAGGTPVPGLFAAGEVTGGIHGSNRIGGNAVTDYVVFGRVAGKSAADYASKL